jgi:hypothetical protein
MSVWISALIFRLRVVVWLFVIAGGIAVGRLRKALASGRTFFVLRRNLPALRRAEPAW